MRITASHAVRAALLAVGVAGSAGAPAAVTLTSDTAFGVDSVIRDVTHRKDFLRLDFTTPYTYDEVAARLGPGGTFAGWRIATGYDMASLGIAAGLVDGSDDPAQVAASAQLLDWFCPVGTCTNTSSTHVYNFGLIADQIEVDIGNGRAIVQEAFSMGVYTVPDPDQVNYRIGGWYYANAQMMPTQGVFLVRAVPEPGTWGLMGAGLMLVTLALRRRRA